MKTQITRWYELLPELLKPRFSWKSFKLKINGFYLLNLKYVLAVIIFEYNVQKTKKEISRFQSKHFFCQTRKSEIDQFLLVQFSRHYDPRISIVASPHEQNIVIRTQGKNMYLKWRFTIKKEFENTQNFIFYISSLEHCNLQQSQS